MQQSTTPTKSLTVSLDENLELLEVDLLFGTSSTHFAVVVVGRLKR
jgi:hypothetical protein